MTARTRRIALCHCRIENNWLDASTDRKTSLFRNSFQGRVSARFFMTKRYLRPLTPYIHLLLSSTTPSHPSRAMPTAPEPFTYKVQKVGFWVIDLTPLKKLTFSGKFTTNWPHRVLRNMHFPYICRGCKGWKEESLRILWFLIDVLSARMFCSGNSWLFSWFSQGWFCHF